MSDNKLVKTFLEATTLAGLVAGIGWGAKKAFNKSFTADPSNSFENFGMFTVAVAAAIALKRYLEDQKIIPNTV